MGVALATRLLEAGYDVAVYNRTRVEGEPLAELGATIVDQPAELADRDIVFTMVAGSADFKKVVIGPDGLLSRVGTGAGGRRRLDHDLRRGLGRGQSRRPQERGTALLAAPVSGNPKVVKAGRLTMVTSGPEDAHRAALPYLEIMAARRRHLRAARATAPGWSRSATT